MTDLVYRPVAHDHKKLIEKARKKGFEEAYAALEDEYTLARELLAARSKAGLTQAMGPTSSSPGAPPPVPPSRRR